MPIAARECRASAAVRPVIWSRRAPQTSDVLIVAFCGPIRGPIRHFQPTPADRLPRETGFLPYPVGFESRLLLKQPPLDLSIVRLGDLPESVIVPPRFTRLRVRNSKFGHSFRNSRFCGRVPMQLFVPCQHWIRLAFSTTEPLLPRSGVLVRSHGGSNAVVQCDGHHETCGVVDGAKCPRRGKPVVAHVARGERRHDSVANTRYTPTATTITHTNPYPKAQQPSASLRSKAACASAPGCRRLSDTVVCDWPIPRRGSKRQHDFPPRFHCVNAAADRIASIPICTPTARMCATALTHEVELALYQKQLDWGTLNV